MTNRYWSASTLHVLRCIALASWAFSATSTALSNGDDIFGPPIDNIPSPPHLRANALESSVQLSLRCGANSNVLYRRANGSAYKRLTSPDISHCPKQVIDTVVQPGTSYCYRLNTTYLSAPSETVSCDITPHEKVRFQSTSISAQESARVLDEFSWSRTDAVAEGSPPKLYYMNILVREKEAIDALYHLGVQVLKTPLFNKEVEAWRAESAIVTDEEGAVGTWLYAVVPGFAYNTIREQSLASLDAGETPVYEAIVYRPWSEPTARDATWSESLSYSYLRAGGFVYTVEPRSGCSTGESGVGCSQHPI